MFTPADTAHAQLHGSFHWKVPARFNIADVCCARWARETPEALAVLYEHENGQQLHCSYASLQAQANRLSHALQRLGVGPGDRVAIVMPQRVGETLSLTSPSTSWVRWPCLVDALGPDALAYRLQHSRA